MISDVEASGGETGRPSAAMMLEITAFCNCPWPGLLSFCRHSLLAWNWPEHAPCTSSLLLGRKPGTKSDCFRRCLSLFCVVCIGGWGHCFLPMKDSELGTRSSSLTLWLVIVFSVDICGVLFGWVLKAFVCMILQWVWWVVVGQAQVCCVEPSPVEPVCQYDLWMCAVCMCVWTVSLAIFTGVCWTQCMHKAVCALMELLIHIGA